MKRGVRVGQYKRLSAQIVSGVNENDRTIVHPDDRMHALLNGKPARFPPELTP